MLTYLMIFVGILLAWFVAVLVGEGIGKTLLRRRKQAWGRFA